MRRKYANKAVRAPEKSSRRTMIPRDCSAKRLLEVIVHIWWRNCVRESRFRFEKRASSKRPFHASVKIIHF
jgi:hypothetical protein